MWFPGLPRTKKNFPWLSKALKFKGKFHKSNNFPGQETLDWCISLYIKLLPIFRKFQKSNTPLKEDTVRALCLTIRQHTRQLFLVTPKTPCIVIQSQHIRFIVIFVIVIITLKCCVWQAVWNSINLYTSCVPYSESKQLKLAVVMTFKHLYIFCRHHTFSQIEQVITIKFQFNSLCDYISTLQYQTTYHKYNTNSANRIW